MIKLKAVAAILIEFFLLFAIIVGLAVKPQEIWAAGQNQSAGEAGSVAMGQSLPELKERLWKATDKQEIGNIVDVINSLSGPNAEAAQILLDYLKDSLRVNAGNIIEALVKLMTEEQVSQLAKEIEVYNQANSYQYLVSVLAARISNSNDLTNAVLSLQDEYVSEVYLQFMTQTWPKIFTDSSAAVQWLDETYTKLSSSTARENLIYAVGTVAKKHLSGDRRSAATGWLWRAQEKEPDLDYRCDQLITLYELGEAKALEAIDGFYSGITSPMKRVELIRRITWQMKEACQDGLIDWLWKVAGTDTSPYCRQECLSVLYTDLGQEKALDQYVRDTDQNGVMGLTQEDPVLLDGGLNWQFLKAASQKYPQSYLGRGIKAYEAVRGIPYFEIDRINKKQSQSTWGPPYWDGYTPYGDEQYQPDREIPGWEKFLAEFPRHPASDDAAYRLARCYEIRGRFADAVKTMQKARFSTDGDIRYAAAGRMVYILDVRMTYDELMELSLEKLETPLQAYVKYSLAVREVRRENYSQAACRLVEFLEQEEKLTADQPILPFDHFYDDEQYDFYGAVKNQLDEVNKLATLKSQWEKSKAPVDLYNLAAASFHNQLLYYNHLWAGQRQYYNWLGYINDMGYGHAPAEMATFVRELINYNHSLPYFQQVYQNPSSNPELKAKALYSTGLCYNGLLEWGGDALFAFNSSDIMEKMTISYQKFVKEYPDSSMADDALLALGAYTGDAIYLNRIVKEYPNGDMLEKAKKLMQDVESPYYKSSHLFGSSVPFKILSLNDESVPQAIKEWAVANSLQFFTGAKISGEWNYVFISAGEKPTAGYGVGIIFIYSDGGSKLKVNYKINDPVPGEMVAQMISYPSVLVRIPVSNTPIEFVEQSTQ